MTSSLNLSVLDLIPVRQGHTSADAMAASMDLVRHADSLGLQRYWFAEHHNMPAVASTTPPVLISAAAAMTSRIRVGSGGVMLPNHAPLVVAEQFAALEAMNPGRIDLGLGRAPGSDPVISQLLRMSGTTSDADRFPEHVSTIRALLHGDGATINFSSGGTYQVRATPAAESSPELWLLGSSDFSARLAAQLGLPYAFAFHFSGQGIDQALDLYRSTYQPSEQYPEPRTFLPVNAVVAPTQEEARARALPQARVMTRLRMNQPLTPLESVEQAQAAGDDLPPVAVAQAQTNWFIGTPDVVADQLTGFAEHHGVNEIMISPVAGAYQDEPARQSRGRVQTLQLLTEALAPSAATAPALH